MHEKVNRNATKLMMTLQLHRCCITPPKSLCPPNTVQSTKSSKVVLSLEIVLFADKGGMEFLIEPAHFFPLFHSVPLFPSEQNACKLVSAQTELH